MYWIFIRTIYVALVSRALKGGIFAAGEWARLLGGMALFPYMSMVRVLCVCQELCSNIMIFFDLLMFFFILKHF